MVRNRSWAGNWSPYQSWSSNLIAFIWQSNFQKFHGYRVQAPGPRQQDVLEMRKFMHVTWISGGNTDHVRNGARLGSDCRQKRNNTRLSDQQLGMGISQVCILKRTIYYFHKSFYQKCRCLSILKVFMIYWYLNKWLRLSLSLNVIPFIPVNPQNVQNKVY